MQCQEGAVLNRKSRNACQMPGTKERPSPDAISEEEGEGDEGETAEAITEAGHGPYDMYMS